MSGVIAAKSFGIAAIDLGIHGKPSSIPAREEQFLRRIGSGSVVATTTR